MNEGIRDREIIERLFSRDETAVQEILAQYGDRLKKLAMGFLQDTRDAEECVNDALLKAWNQIPPYRPENLYAYLARLVRLTAFDKIDYRKAAKRNMKIVELTREMEECLPAPVDRSLDESFLSSLINDFLGTLSEEKRFFFVRRYWYEDSIEQIAQAASCSKSKVKTTLHRTRESLRRYLERNGI